jgi:hypothetical protein
LRAHLHCVDREPPTVVEFEYHDLEQVRRAIRPEEQRPVRFIVSFLERMARERVLDGVNDVCIRNAVLAT